jgi:uncharacterized membrane protein
VLGDKGIPLEPIQIALWGIPTAICAFVIHAWRIMRFEQAMTARLAQANTPASNESAAE